MPVMGNDPLGMMPGAGIVGGLIDRAWATDDSAAGRAAQAEMTEEGRRWAQFMRQTAYQDTVRDMKNAGLNPMLAYSQGASSTPTSGGAAPPAVTRAPGGNLLTGMQTAAQIRNVDAQTDNIKADTANKEAENPFFRGKAGKQDQEVAKLRAEVEKILQDTDLSEQQTRKVYEEVKNAVKEGRRIEAHTGNIEVDTQLKKLDVPRASNIAEQQSSWWMKHISPYLGDLNRITNSARDAARTIGR